MHRTAVSGAKPCEYLMKIWLQEGEGSADGGVAGNSYEFVILNGGEAGMRDLTWAEGFCAAEGTANYAYVIGTPVGASGRCTRVVGSFGGLAPSSG